MSVLDEYFAEVRRAFSAERTKAPDVVDFDARLDALWKKMSPEEQDEARVRFIKEWKS